MTQMTGKNGARWLVALLIGALLVVVPGGSWLGARAADAQAKEFRAGVALSLSGIFSRDAALFKEVYDLWAETVNRAGGIKVKGAACRFASSTMTTSRPAEERAARRATGGVGQGRHDPGRLRVEHRVRGERGGGEVQVGRDRSAPTRA